MMLDIADRHPAGIEPGGMIMSSSLLSRRWPLGPDAEGETRPGLEGRPFDRPQLGLDRLQRAPVAVVGVLRGPSYCLGTRPARPPGPVRAWAATISTLVAHKSTHF